MKRYTFVFGTVPTTCPETRRPCRGRKDIPIRPRVGFFKSLRLLEKAAAECDVVRANCHRERRDGGARDKKRK
jgi:hypothetical protein